MIAEPLSRVLESTGYLVAGEPAAPSVSLASPGVSWRLRSLRPDAMWRSTASAHLNGASGAVDLSAFFKFADAGTDRGAAVAGWQQEVWNHGFTALLWVVWADRVEIYNGFGRPRAAGEETANLLQTFGHDEADLTDLDSFAGRLVMETGEFWARQGHRVDRKTGVDTQLLRDLSRLEHDLVEGGLDHDEAQGLIGRTVFAQYLIDREIVTSERLRELCGSVELAEILVDRRAAGRLFGWLRDKFNGDMFSPLRDILPETMHLSRVASFLRAVDPDTGQLSIFPYRFDVIPVELISSIYESFVHSASTTRREGDTTRLAEDVHYTPLTAVSMVLDQVFHGLTGDETVIDLTCGSGVFLVEALRRLVRLKVGDRMPDRAIIRKVLYEQVFGVDKSEAAVRIAAFSLYLAALELDPDPIDPQSRGFEPLIGSTLLVGDARTIHETEDGKRVLTTGSGLKRFDVVVGNPPWSYTGKAGNVIRHQAGSATPLTPRGQGFDFVHRGIEFAHGKTRFGVLVNAPPFFSRSATGAEAVRHLLESLGPVTLVNLSELSNWLFPRANMPAMAIIARHRPGRPDSVQLVQARRSLQGDHSRAIDLSSSNSSTLPVASWKRNAGLLKAAFLGHKHDLLLVDRLCKRFEPLNDRLEALGTRLASGLILGDAGNRTRDASTLVDLPFLRGGDLERFRIPSVLPPFKENRAQWPRTRATYQAPLVLVKEYITKSKVVNSQGRAVVAVSEDDLVYTASCSGIPLSNVSRDVSYLLAGVLSSALASWFNLMTGSTFGLWKRRLLPSDIRALPTPDLKAVVKTDAAMRIVGLVRGFHSKSPGTAEWKSLDDLVFELYQLDQEERVVVQDGWLRSTWEWKAGRDVACAPAQTRDLEAYARAFMLSMDAWLFAANARRFSAQIYEFEPHAPIRAVRFILEDHPPPSRQVGVASRRIPTREFLGQISGRLGRQVFQDLVGMRQLRIHSKREVIVMKPVARRFWLGVTGLDDARAVMMESVKGRRA